MSELLLKEQELQLKQDGQMANVAQMQQKGMEQEAPVQPERPPTAPQGM